MSTKTTNSSAHSPTMREQIIGTDTLVPVLDGRLVPYVNFDNAASTPPLREVMDEIGKFIPYYSSVHRGTGFKSRISTKVYELSREIVGRFVGADLSTNTVIFGKNTTEAINKLSYRLKAPPDFVVITTMMEHHSNDLPWRNRYNVVHVNVTPDGQLDEKDFDRKLEKYKNRTALVAVSGASNVTGYLQPVYRLARKAHRREIKILVDAAQLASHRRVDMRPDDDPEHLDFVALSAHKMYAPFGTGALIGPREVFNRNGPEYRGGGTVDVVTLDNVYWSETPDRDEAGSPNVVGGLAMAVATQVLSAAGLDKIAAHEQKLTSYCLRRLKAVPGITIYGETDPAKAHNKLGVIPFNLQGVSHFLVAAILGYEGGIGVRSGCFCAHPYVVHLLRLDAAEKARWQKQLLAGDKSHMPGMVRISFGCYNIIEEIDRLVEMLMRITRNEYSGKYYIDSRSGEYLPVDYEEALGEYLYLKNVLEPD